MNSNLFVPIQTRALFLSKDTLGSAPSIDFRRLPYKTSFGEVHPNTPYLSNAIVSEPFQDIGFLLQKGIHLHWELPSIYTLARGEGHDLPPAPNRWLLTRRIGADMKQWVIESDQLSETAPEGTALTVIPLPFDTNRLGQPYRFIGSTREIDNYSPGEHTDYWARHWKKPFTATGYGDPHFASFYPNCSSVFGFHDAEIEVIPAEGIKYEVIGWHHQTEDSPFVQTAKEFLSPSFRFAQEQLIQYGQRMGEAVWEQLTSSSQFDIDVIQPQESSPISDADLDRFLSPSPLKTLIEKDDLLTEAILGSAEDIDGELDSLWAELDDKHWINIEDQSEHPDQASIVADPELRFALDIAFASNESAILTLFQQKKQGNIFPRQRLIDRYGEESAGPVWTIIQEQNWTEALWPNHLLLTGTISKDWVAGLAHTPSYNLIQQDVSHNRLFNLHARWGTVDQASIDARFPPSPDNSTWTALQNAYRNDTRTLCKLDDQPITVGTTYSVLHQFSSLLQRNFSHAPKSLIHQSDLLALFKQKALETWTYAIQKTWILPDAGKAIPEAQTNPVAAPYDSLDGITVPYLSFHLQKQELESRIGDRADQVWQDLIQTGKINENPAGSGLGLARAGSITGLFVRYSQEIQDEIEDFVIGPDYSVASIQQLLANFADQLWADALQIGWLKSDERHRVYFEPRTSWKEVANRPLLDKQRRWLDVFIRQLLSDSESDLQRFFGDAQGTSLYQTLTQENYFDQSPQPLSGLFTFFQTHPEGTSELIDSFADLLRVRFTKAQFKTYLKEEVAVPLWKALVQAGRIDTAPADHAYSLFNPELNEYMDTVMAADPESDEYAYLSLIQKFLMTFHGTKFQDLLQLKLYHSYAQSQLDRSIQPQDQESVVEDLSQRGWGHRLPLDYPLFLIAPTSYRQALTTAADREKEMSILLDVVHLKNYQNFTSSCCFSRVRILPTADQQNPALDSQNLNISIGNTGTEAISAYLAHEIDAGNQGQMEHQLEAISFLEKFQASSNDVGARLTELRHSKGFRAEKGNLRWTIYQVSANQSKTDAVVEVALPEELAHMLHQLNRTQAAYDQSLANITQMRRLLFFDWHKYMVAIYPPEDGNLNYPDIQQIQAFIEDFDIEPLKRLMASTGLVHLVETPVAVNQAHASLMGEEEGDLLLEQSLAWKLAGQINAVIQSLSQVNAERISQGLGPYRLKASSDEHFFRPTDLHMVLTGDLTAGSYARDVEESLELDRQGAYIIDNFLDFDDFNKILEPTFYQYVTTVLDALFAIEPALDGMSLANGEVSQQAWDPMLFDWMVYFQPLYDPNQTEAFIHKKALGYHTDFLSNTYTLAPNTSVLSLQSGNAELSDHVSVYSGRTFLSHTFNNVFRQRLEAYLKNEVGVDWLDEFLLNPSQKLSEYVADHQLNNEKEKADDPVYTALRALDHLLSHPTLTQALSGLNAAFLASHSIFQLPVGDPLGFEVFRAFGAKVKHYVEEENIHAPAPLNDLQAIRAGAMQMRQLRVIDRFGMYVDKPVDSVNIAQTLQSDFDSDKIGIPPRFPQAARLNCRWQSAINNDIETNEHPASNPICGWIIPNQLDDAFLIYAPSGSLLGWVNEAGNWITPPDKSSITLDQVRLVNAHLADFVDWLRNKDSAQRADFLSSIINSLDNIAPEYATQHQALSLLMSRPIALARVNISLELKHIPVSDHKWDSFRGSLAITDRMRSEKVYFQPEEVGDFIKATRQTYGFTEVTVPVRIGDYHKLNDGLVGYWMGDIDPATDTYYAAESSNSAPHLLQLSLDHPAQTLTCLLDPQGELHAVCGMLPSKQISLPADMYQEALQKMEVDFLTAPIISPKNSLDIPLPEEVGYTWSFLRKHAGQYPNYSGNIMSGGGYIHTPYLDPIQFREAWKQHNATTYWDYLLGAGFLIESEDHFSIADFTAPGLQMYSDNFEFSDAAFTKVDSVKHILWAIRPLISLVSPIRKEDFVNKWVALSSEESEAVQLVNYLLLHNWLTDIGPRPYLHVVRASKRTKQTLDEKWLGKDATVEELLHTLAYRLSEVKTEATFDTSNEIIEGWLNLSK
ncbi:MAG: hypothetical protein AAF587_29970 [Bacteroidota bacterium]